MSRVGEFVKFRGGTWRVVEIEEGTRSILVDEWAVNSLKDRIAHAEILNKQVEDFLEGDTITLEWQGCLLLRVNEGETERYRLYTKFIVRKEKQEQCPNATSENTEKPSESPKSPS